MTEESPFSTSEILRFARDDIFLLAKFSSQLREDFQPSIRIRFTPDLGLAAVSTDLLVPISAFSWVIIHTIRRLDKNFRQVPV
jgi:hypothetical protein